MELPAGGATPDEVRKLLADAATGDMPWRDGRGWSLVFDLPGEHHNLVGEALAAFANENALSYSAFPSAARFESAVISMVASVVCPSVEHFGVFTSGGTESILLATKAYRDRVGAHGSTVVVPETAHPAFGKAAQMLGLTVVRVPVGSSGAADPDDIAAAIDSDTLMVALSAPNFPFGVVDPIAAVAAIAKSRGVGVHVDAALGGLFLPFIDDLPEDSRQLGLEVDGVTSVSVDLHKYGYGAKGASVLLFGSRELRHASYYVDPGWPGGAYAASGVLGTRSVGPSAAAFTSLSLLGRDGFRARVAGVMATTAVLQSALVDEAGLSLLGAPAMSVFATGGEPARLHQLMRGLKQRGWWIDGMTRPRAIHFMVFPRHAEVAPQFLTDLRAAMHDPIGDGAATEVAAYGVMVRGESASEDDLRTHLDRRFDAQPLD